MDWQGLFALLLIGLLLLIALALFQRRFKKAEKPNWPFYAKRPLSEIEQIFYWRLLKACPEYLVLPQMPLSRFLGVRRGHDFRTWFNRIDRMTVDYLVCRKDFSIVAAIELDDATHRRPERQQADAKKEKALKAAGLRLMRFPVKPLPEERAIRARIFQHPETPEEFATPDKPAPRLQTQREDRILMNTKL